MSDSQWEKLIDKVNAARDERGIEIGGKKYSQVKDRVEVFRREFGAKYGIDTHVDYENYDKTGMVVATAKIGDVERGTTVSSGHAVEFVASNEVTLTAAIESAETAAVGRALAFFGLAGGEFPSDAEMGSIDRKRETVASQRNAAQNERQRQIEEYREQQAKLPPEQRDTVRRYLPPQGQELDHPAEASKIADELVMVKTSQELTAYWHDLKEYRAFLAGADRHTLAEITAMFTMLKHQLADANK
jgi:hypothetical protein